MKFMKDKITEIEVYMAGHIKPEICDYECQFQCYSAHQKLMCNFSKN